MENKILTQQTNLNEKVLEYEETILTEEWETVDLKGLCFCFRNIRRKNKIN